MKARVTLTLEKNLVKDIDEARGLIPRSRFVESLPSSAFSEFIEEVEVDGYA